MPLNKTEGRGFEEESALDRTKHKRVKVTGRGGIGGGVREAHIGVGIYRSSLITVIFSVEENYFWQRLVYNNLTYLPHPY